MSLGDGLTWRDWTRLVAAEYGIHGLTDADVDLVLWNRTAWPITCEPSHIRPQLIAALLGEPEPCPCCGGPLKGDGEHATGVCRGCAVRHGWVPVECPDRW